MILEQERYRVKTVSYDEDGPGLYTFMVVRFDAVGLEWLRRNGWSDHDNFMFVRMEPGLSMCHHDPFVLSNKIAAHDDDHLKQLLVEIKDGHMWDIIEDGGVYTPGDIDRLVDEYGIHY